MEISKVKKPVLSGKIRIVTNVDSPKVLGTIYNASNGT